MGAIAIASPQICKHLTALSRAPQLRIDMQNIEQNAFPVVPWTRRDVWFGIGGLALWIILSAAIGFVGILLGLKLDLGVYISLGEALLLIPPWLLAVRKYHIGWGSLGLRPFNTVILGYALAILIVFYAFNGAYNLLLQYVFHVTSQANLIQTLNSVNWTGWLWIGGVGVAPFVEEIFFRGFVFGGLRQSMGWKKAAVISGILFAAVHLDLAAVLPIFILGVAFAYIYNRCHSIWPTILMHMTINAIGLSALFFLTR